MILSNVTKRPIVFALISTTLFAFAQVNVAAAASTLTISGAPATAVTVGQTYAFTPSVNRYSRYLRYTVSGQPGWLYFSSRRGTLYGVPSSANVGSYSNITITVSDGRSTATMKPFAIKVSGTTTTTPPPTTPTDPTPPPVTPTNTAPTITGSPATTVSSGQAYSFKPTAADANGDALTYSITGLPTWASFNAQTGLLSGTPAYTDAGLYSNIVIKVSDGKVSTALSAFNLTVNQVASGRATVSWAPPTQNTDGSAITNLAGYRISYGNSASALNTVVTIATTGVTNTLIDNLAPGVWYFAVKAYNSTGDESSASTVASKTIL